jgi:putative oxidoreductase
MQTGSQGCLGWSAVLGRKRRDRRPAAVDGRSPGRRARREGAEEMTRPPVGRIDETGTFASDRRAPGALGGVGRRDARHPLSERPSPYRHSTQGTSGENRKRRGKGGGMARKRICAKRHTCGGDVRNDLGLLALRLGAGSVLVAHGTQKLFGWFGGGGLSATGEGMEQMGFRPGRNAALAAGLGETGGGSLLALGLATPVAGAAAAGVMASAVSMHAPAGFFAAQGGFEHPGFLGLAGTSVGIAGPGRFSLDHVLGHRLNRPWMLGVAYAAVAAAAGFVVSRRLSEQGGGQGDAASSESEQTGT